MPQRAIEHGYYGRRFGIGMDILPYQVAVGVSVRWFERSLAFRVYVGPLKLWGHAHLRLPVEAE